MMSVSKPSKGFERRFIIEDEVKHENFEFSLAWKGRAESRLNPIAERFQFFILAREDVKNAPTANKLKPN